MRKIFIKKNIPIFILFFLVLGISLSFIGESVGRSISLTLITSSFLIAYLLTKNISFSLLLFLFLALPLNITYQIPISFENSLVDGISVNYLIPTLSVLDFGLGIFIAIAVMKKPHVLKEVFAEFGIPIIMFLLFLLVQNILLRNPLVLLSSLREILYYSSFLVFLKLWKIEKKKYNYKLASVVLLISVLFQSIVGFLQFIKGSSLGIYFLGESKGVAGLVGSSFVALGDELFLRASGTFPHPNILAGFLLLSFFSAIYLSKKLQKKFKIIAYSTLVLCSICLILTFSRTVILLSVFLLSSLLLGKIMFGRKVYSFTLPLFFERFLSLFSMGEDSWVDRINLVKASFVVIKQNWTLGTGLGNYVKGMEGFFPTTSRSMPLLQPVHNIFLLLFAELGVIGFVLYLYLFYQIMRRYYKRITIYGGLIFFSVLVIGMVDHYFASLPQGQIIFFLLISLAIVSSEEELQNKKKKINKN